jgi:hypothetical protein
MYKGEQIDITNFLHNTLQENHYDKKFFKRLLTIINENNEMTSQEEVLNELFIGLPLYIKNKIILTITRAESLNKISNVNMATALFEFFNSTFDLTLKYIYNICDSENESILRKDKIKTLIIDMMKFNDEKHYIKIKDDEEYIFYTNELVESFFHEETLINFEQFTNIIKYQNSDLYFFILLFILKNLRIQDILMFFERSTNKKNYYKENFIIQNQSIIFPKFESIQFLITKQNYNLLNYFKITTGKNIKIVEDFPLPQLYLDEPAHVKVVTIFTKDIQSLRSKKKLKLNLPESTELDHKKTINNSKIIQIQSPRQILQEKCLIKLSNNIEQKIWLTKVGNFLFLNEDKFPIILLKTILIQKNTLQLSDCNINAINTGYLYLIILESEKIEIHFNNKQIFKEILSFLEK